MGLDPILLAVDRMAMGGTERQVLELLRGLKQSRRFAVVLSILDHGGELDAAAGDASETVLRVTRKARFDWTPAVSMTWHARRAGIRLIHAIGWLSGMAGLAAAHCLRVPILNGSVRAAPPRLERRDRISRWCARRSDWIVANSEAGLRAYGLRGHPHAQVIPNGLDLARFAEAAAAPTRPDRPTVCMVANFSDWKDHATVIRAMTRVRNALPECQLVLVGADRGTLAANQRLAAELGVSSAIQFVTGEVNPHRTIASSHVCVLASASESFSNAILEYMALARPVVATDTCGDTASLIRDSAAGLLVPHGSPASLADAVISLLVNPARARQMGEAGRRQAGSFSATRMVAAYEELYARLLRSPRTG